MKLFIVMVLFIADTLGKKQFLFLCSKVKRSNTVAFKILAGDRVLKYLGKASDNERALTRLLSVGPDDHAVAVERIQNSLKSVNKVTKSQLKEIAQLEAYQLKATSEAQTYIYIHFNSTEMDESRSCEI